MFAQFSSAEMTTTTALPFHLSHVITPVTTGSVTYELKRIITTGTINSTRQISLIALEI